MPPCVCLSIDTRSLYLPLFTYPLISMGIRRCIGGDKKEEEGEKRIGIDDR